MKDNLFSGFTKNADGVVTKVTLGTDKERERRIYLMKKDGLSVEEVEELEGELSEEEREGFRDD